MVIGFQHLKAVNNIVIHTNIIENHGFHTTSLNRLKTRKTSIPLSIKGLKLPILFAVDLKTNSVELDLLSELSVYCHLFILHLNYLVWSKLRLIISYYYLTSIAAPITPACPPRVVGTILIEDASCGYTYSFTFSCSGAKMNCFDSITPPPTIKI